jgi:hypothetical protein
MQMLNDVALVYAPGRVFIYLSLILQKHANQCAMQANVNMQQQRQA